MVKMNSSAKVNIYPKKTREVILKPSNIIRIYGVVFVNIDAQIPVYGF